MELEEPIGFAGVDGLTDRELLEYVAGMLARLEPLVETLERFAPIAADLAEGGNGKRPSPFKMALAAAKLAGG